MGEYANMIAGSAMMVVLFFGGWTLPWVSAPASTVGAGIFHIAVFIAKLLFFMVVFIWVRWMIPRFRYDQLMELGWRRAVPFALFNIIFYASVFFIGAKFAGK
jgi:NADH-quinone oxidoreductase subunit H